MAILKKHLISPAHPRRTQITTHKGKGAVEEHLPSSGSMSTLTGGSPFDRSMQSYPKPSPEPPSAPESAPVMDMDNDGQ